MDIEKLLQGLLNDEDSINGILRQVNYRKSMGNMGGGAMNLEAYKINPYNSMIFQYGGSPNLYAGEIEKAFLGKIIKGIGKGIGKVGEGIWQGVKGTADFALGAVGAPDVIQDTFVDRSGFLSGVNNVIGSVGRAGLDLVAPGVGSAIGAVGGTLNNAVNNGRQNKQARQAQQDFDNSAAGGLQHLMGLLSGAGFGMNQNGDIGGLLSSLFANGNFDNGGIVKAVPEGLEPIQAEKYKGNEEMIVFSDNRITQTNAETSHEKMEENHITDVLPANSYIASSRKEMSLGKDTLKDIVFGYSSLPYEEHAKGKIPQAITAADVLKSGDKKKILPSVYAKRIQEKYPIVDNDDMFTKAANTENIRARTPFIQTLVTLGENNRMEQEEQTSEFKYGGYIPRKANAGLISGLGAASGILGGVLGGIGSILNVGSQRRALRDSEQQLGQLTGQLNDLNNQGTLAGILGQLAQDTNLQEVDFNTTRLENFNTSTPQSFIDAQADDNIDTTAVLDRLGDRSGVGFLANINQQSQNARNVAAQRAFENQTNQDFGIAQTLTGIENQENQINTNLRNQETAARNNVFNNIAGQIQGNFQNRTNIASQEYSAATDLSLRRAGLAGQELSAVGNALTSIGGIATSSQSELSALGSLFSSPNSAPSDPNSTMSSGEIKALFPSQVPAINVPPRSGVSSTGFFSGASQQIPSANQLFPITPFNGFSALPNTYVPQQIPGALNTYMLDQPIRQLGL